VRVGVVGCGLVGAAVARELQLRGVQTVVYEATRPGEGTSGTTFAWVNSLDKEPRAYHDLNVAGMQAHAELQASDRSTAEWFFPTGNLVWVSEEAAAARFAGRRERLASFGYPMVELSVETARELEPGVIFDGAEESVFLFPFEGYVLPAILVGRLLGEALDRGAELRSLAVVEAVEFVAGGVRLRLGDGSSDQVDMVVCCAGRWTAEVMIAAGYSLPMVDSRRKGSSAVGYLAYTRPAPVGLGRVVTSPRLNIRPDGGGRLVLQALDLDSAADPTVDAPEPGGAVGSEFERRAARILQGGEAIRLAAIRVGQRALPADGLSVVGQVDDAGRLYVVVTHSGVTLAPLLARLAADEIVESARHELLEPFRPQRLVSRESAATDGIRTRGVNPETR
jgi:glycine/D-amino acid oxidase-like deaminating enzyme